MTVAHVWFCLQILVYFKKGQCESKLHQTTTATTKNNNIVYMVRTKESELSEFPGVNTPSDIGVSPHLVLFIEGMFCISNILYFNIFGYETCRPVFKGSQ